MLPLPPPAYEGIRLDEPALSKKLSMGTLWLYRFFDALFHSRFNPLYRSGTIALLMFLVLVVTGVYLLCFYDVGSPYESVVTIHEKIFIGKTVRTIHRYATDIGILAIALHFLQILLQGKTWGPRVLAWMSGMIMLGFFYLSAWTGYVMVWDVHGEYLAQAGTLLIQALPFVSEPVAQAFSGEKALPDAFFFMNLFLHVALPLLFVIGLLIHTARIKRTQWLPPRVILYVLMAGLILVSLVYPSPLLDKADLLKMTGKIPTDLFAAVWLTTIPFFGASFSFYVGILIFLVFLFAFIWWKSPLPLEGRQSIVQETLCTGCTQCATDCPYEAITMVTPRDGRKRMLAEVALSNCVSCGICSASCLDFAIGPPRRNGKDQADATEQLLQQITQSGPVDVIVAYCSNNPGITERVKLLGGMCDKNIAYFPLQCAGTLHNETLTRLMKMTKHVIVWGCAERVCMNRDGITLLKGRFERKRVPFLDKKLDRSHASLFTLSSWEIEEVAQSILFPKKYDAVHTCSPRKYCSSIASTGIVLVLVAFASQYPYGEVPSVGLVRLAGSLPALKKSDCRALTTEEQAGLPAHMTRQEICQERHLSFDLSIKIDGVELPRSYIEPGGLHKDRPVYLNQEIEVIPGTHNITVDLRPSPPTSKNDTAMSLNKDFVIDAGSVALLLPDVHNNTFSLVQSKKD